MGKKKKSKRPVTPNKKQHSSCETAGILGQKLMQAISQREAKKHLGVQYVEKSASKSKSIPNQKICEDFGSRKQEAKPDRRVIEIKGKSGVNKVEVQSADDSIMVKPQLKKPVKKITKQKPPKKDSKRAVHSKKVPSKVTGKGSIWKPVDQSSKIDLNATRIEGGISNQFKKSYSTLGKRLSWQVFKETFSDERDIVIGFDLGTACTKVTLQDRNLSTAFAVSFGEFAYRANEYFIPTRVFVDDFGKIGFEPNGTQISDIKLHFIENPERSIFEEKTSDQKASAIDFAGAYIGLVLIQVRRWFHEHKATDYARSKITWQLNLGIPTRDYENKRLVEALRLAAITGWNLTLDVAQPYEVSIKAVKKARNLAENQIDSNEQQLNDVEKIHPEEVFVTPEIIAEVIGYARSPMRRNGMFLIVDVGATTLDVSTFILHEGDDEDTYPILFADVAKLGGYELHKTRIQKVTDIVRNKLCVLSDSCDGISPLPEHEEYFPKLSEEDFLDFPNCDREFSKRCSLAMRRVVGATKKKRNPLSDAWNNGLPVFLCGGGSEISVYRKSVGDAFDALSPMGINGFSFVPLPKPDNFETQDIPHRDYHRFAVSYGLSYSEIDIGKIISQKELDDIDPSKPLLDTEAVFVDKDMV